jgi:pimeloyl-ACP methyl ester carboxylesterase
MGFLWTGLFLLFGFSAAGAPGRLIDVGGRNLHLYCTGSGSPTIVMEAGAAEGWYTFDAIQGPLSREFRTCSYDRAGFGFSDPRPGERTVVGIVADLHELLRRAEEKPPFVLVGHSLGGDLALKYYTTHRDQVSGMVLIDASHSDGPSIRPPAMQKRMDALNAERPKQLAEWRRTGKWPEMGAPEPLPADLRKTVLRLSASQKWWEARYAEGRMADLNEPIPSANRYIDVPFAVIVANRWDKPDGWSDATLAKYMNDRLKLQRELASRGKRSELLVVDSAHHVHFEQPQLVIEAIRRIAKSQ